MKKIKFYNTFFYMKEMEVKYIENKNVFKYLYEYKNFEFIDLLNKYKLQTNFDTEVITPLLSTNTSILDIKNDIKKDKFKRNYSNSSGRMIASIMINTKNIYLYYWLRNYFVYKMYLDLLKNFALKYNIHLKLDYEKIIEDEFDLLEEKNFFYEETNWIQKSSYNSFQIIYPNSHLISRIAFNYSYEFFVDFYKPELLQKSGGMLKYINEPDLNTKYKMENNFLFTIDDKKSMSKKNLKTYLMTFTNYQLWLNTINRYKKLNLFIEWKEKDYSLLVEECEIISIEEFRNFYLNKSELTNYIFLLNEFDNKREKEYINLIIGIMCFKKVSLNYAQLLIYLNKDIIFDDNNIVTTLNSLHYYYKLVHLLLKKQNLNDDEKFYDVKIKSRSLRNYNSIDKEYKVFNKLKNR